MDEGEKRDLISKTWKDAAPLLNTKGISHNSRTESKKVLSLPISFVSMCLYVYVSTVYVSMCLLYVQEVVTLQKNNNYICIRKWGLHHFLIITIFKEEYYSFIEHNNLRSHELDSIK